MCQQEIINYVKRKRRPVDMRELIVNLPQNRASISRGCRKLREAKEIKFKKKKEKSYEKFFYFM
jgi:hypothetical protein